MASPPMRAALETAPKRGGGPHRDVGGERERVAVMDPDPTDLLLLRGHALLGRDTEIEKQVRARPDGGGGTGVAGKGRG